MQRKLIAIAFIAALGAGAAHGQNLELNQETVKTVDVDMSNKAAVQGLMNRLERASLDVCGAPEGSDRNYVATVKRSDCYAGALAAAVAAAHAPALEEAYAGRSHEAYAQVADR